MKPKDLLKKFNVKKVLLLPVAELEALLNTGEIIVEKDTIVNGKVRILNLAGSILFQEITAKDELALRKFTRLKDAENLVNDRLAVYENMWNGCGCKVNYYE
jgi:hypothetical protein